MYYWMRYQSPLDLRTHHPNLFAKKSTIKGAGKGLFTVVARKKEALICSFHGHWIDKHAWDATKPEDRQDQYAFTLGAVTLPVSVPVCIHTVYMFSHCSVRSGLQVHERGCYT